MAASKDSLSLSSAGPNNAQAISQPPFHTQSRTSSSRSHSHSHPHSHSHSLSLGSVNTLNRVGRRKSSSSHAPSAVALTAISMHLDKTPDGSATANRVARPAIMSGSLPNTSVFESFDDDNTFDTNYLNPLREDEQEYRPRNRRASEGSHTSSKKDSKNDLKCETCGKVYKHSSCLTKHKWEHTPQWIITSKLQISKHQQVQLLEAASVLISIRDTDMEASSSNASATSDTNDDNDFSSIGDSPPPAYYGTDGFHGTSHTVGDYRQKRRESSSDSYGHMDDEHYFSRSREDEDGLFAHQFED